MKRVFVTAHAADNLLYNGSSVTLAPVDWLNPGTLAFSVGVSF